MTNLEKKLILPKEKTWRKKKKFLHLPYLPSIEAGMLVRVTADITAATYASLFLWEEALSKWEGEGSSKGHF